MKNDLVSQAIGSKLKREKDSEFLWQLLEKRWSPRGFADHKIDQEVIASIFEAGQQAASSFNEQPWSVILTSRGSTGGYDRLFACLDEFNQSWVHFAPYLGVVVTKKHFSGNNKKNRHCEYDSGAFMALASLYAATQDVFIHQMAGFSPEKVKENFDLPEDHEPITMFVLGLLGDKEELPASLRKKEDPHSERKEVSEVLFENEWGKPFLNR